MADQDPAYLEPMRDLLGQDVLDAIKAAAWRLVTEDDWQAAMSAYILGAVR